MHLRHLLVVLASCGLTLCRNNNHEEEKDYDGRFDDLDVLPPAPDDLEYAFVIFRHGIRSPIYRPFQTERAFKTMWPEGMGALTDDGKRLMLHVGESLRTRYGNVVPEFDERVVQFTSTHSGRATMSAYCVAAGLFPMKDPIVAEMSTWQPIPIWQNTTYDKHKLFSENKDKSHCRRYTEMRERARAEDKKWTPVLRKRFYRDINRRLAKTFKKNHFVDSFQDVSKIYDIFKSQILNNKKVPDWVYKYMTALEKLKQIRMWSFIHSNTSMIQYFTGPLFNQILKEMTEQSAKSLLQEFTHAESPSVRMHLHGSHDITVCPTVWAISKQETYIALPGDTVLIEMTANAYVKAYLYVPLAEKNERFKELSLEPLCGKGLCRLTEFKDALHDITFDETEWKKRCNSPTPPETKYRDLPQDITEKDLEALSVK